MSKPATFDDGIHDGIQLGLFMALRIVKAEKKLHAYNSGAGRVLKTIESKLLKQADTGVTTAAPTDSSQESGSQNAKAAAPSKVVGETSEL